MAQQAQQIGYAIIDSKAIGCVMPPMFPGTRTDSLEDLAVQLAQPHSVHFTSALD